jgi:hypothetical protein
VTAFIDSPAAAGLIDGMARDLALVRPDGREAWLREFRRGCGADMPAEVVAALVARTKARAAEIESGDDKPTVH